MKNQSKIIVADKPEIELLDSSDRRFLLDALSRGMSRRQALTWMMAAGVTAATAGNLFTQAGSVLAATPKKGGKLIFATRYPRPGSEYLDNRLHARPFPLQQPMPD